MNTYYIKQSLFLYLTPRQKSQLLSYLKSFIKKHSNLSTADILDKFIEEENYYRDIDNPHFEFILEYLDNDEFFREFKIYAEGVFEELRYKEAQRPIIEAQKAKAKEIRKKAQDYKMSKMKPTKKQLYYYEKLTHTHNIEKKDTESASRLDLKNWIMDIIEQNTVGNDKED